MSKKLVVLGSVNADHVLSVPRFPKPGETLVGSGYHIAYGGRGANQAKAAGRIRAVKAFINTDQHLELRGGNVHAGEVLANQLVLELVSQMDQQT